MLPCNSAAQPCARSWLLLRSPDCCISSCACSILACILHCLCIVLYRPVLPDPLCTPAYTCPASCACVLHTALWMLDAALCSCVLHTLLYLACCCAMSYVNCPAPCPHGTHHPGWGSVLNQLTDSSVTADRGQVCVAGTASSRDQPCLQQSGDVHPHWVYTGGPHCQWQPFRAVSWVSLCRWDVLTRGCAWPGRLAAALQPAVFSGSCFAAAGPSSPTPGVTCRSAKLC